MLCFATLSSTNAQNYNLQKQVKEINKKIEQIHNDAKIDLKLKLNNITERLKNKEISRSKANKLKANLKVETKKQIKEQVIIQLKKKRDLYANHKYPSKEIFKAIEKIILEEKLALRDKIKKIEEKLVTNKINKTEAHSLKKEAAVKHASNIESKITLEEIKLQKIVQDFTNKQIATISIDSVDVEIIHGNWSDKKRDKTRKSTTENFERRKASIVKGNERRYDEQGLIAFGLYNVIENSKTSSDYKTWKSKFYEYGYTYKWRLSKNPSPFYFKYGASVVFSNLKATDNLYHVKSGNETSLIIHPNDLKISRLKNVQLILPVHFEVDLSKPDLINGVASARKERSFRFGIGGYGGIRLHTKQILHYKDGDANIKEKTTDNFNLNNFTYGLSGYFGYRSIALYAKYDLNSLFKNSNTEGVSLGLRWEI